MGSLNIGIELFGWVNVIDGNSLIVRDISINKF